jgi:3-dehydroquinate dehydratase-2
MAAKIMILNGPNLNFLGIREPHIYGSTTLQEIEASCQKLAKELGVSISFHQSNLEGELVNLIQAAHGGGADAIIMNPAAYSFTSVALIDALKIFEGPKIEVHISNIHARDELHRHSITSSASTAVICGLGPYGYLAAILAVVQRLGKLPDRIPASLHGLPPGGKAQGK